MDGIARWFAGLCGGRGKISSRDQAAARIQARYRGIRVRDEQHKRNAAATKIQAVRRGHAVRRDMDSRSWFQKREASTAVASDMGEMKQRMKTMAKAMDKHDRKTGEKLVRALRKEDQSWMHREADAEEERLKHIKKHTSRRRL
jgi:threonine synthase